MEPDDKPTPRIKPIIVTNFFFIVPLWKTVIYFFLLKAINLFYNFGSSITLSFFHLFKVIIVSKERSFLDKFHN